MNHPASDGLVYYVLDGSRSTLRCKIGVTTNLGLRLTTLARQTMCRQAPLVLALEPGGYDREVHRHEQFKALRMVGEWFRFEGSLVEHLAELPQPIGWLLERPDLWIYAQGWQGFEGWRVNHQEALAAMPDDTDADHRLPPIVFRLAVDDLAHIDRLAANAGVNRSEMIRRLLQYATGNMPMPNRPD